MTLQLKALLAGTALGAAMLAGCDAGDQSPTVDYGETDTAVEYDQEGYGETDTADTDMNGDDMDMAGTDTDMTNDNTGLSGNGMGMDGDDMNMDGDTIVTVASETSELSTLVTAVQAAGLTQTLNGDGPYTVFAPPNSAFDALPDGALDTLLADSAQLSDVLTYHVVADEVTAEELTSAIEDNEGSYEIYTVNGGVLTASMEGDNVILTDATGSTATITDTDIDASNGVVHLVDTVLMPDSGA